MKTSLLLTCASACALAANAATLTVKPNPGGGEFPTIQAALDRANPGDTVKVTPGVYRENVVVTKGGDPGQPITIEAENGAILDPSVKCDKGWTPAPDIAQGAYRRTVDFFPYTIIADGKTITTLDEKRTDPARPHDARDNLRWPSVFKGGAGEAGWKGLRAVAIYLPSKKDLLIKFRKNLDPNTMDISLASRDPAILVRGCGNLVIRGLEIRNASYGVRMEGADGVTVEKCKIGPADYGIHMEGKTKNCKILDNEIFLDPYPGADPWRAGSWDNWQAHKNGGFYDRYGIRASETKGCEIRGNFIHDHWDGVQTGWPGAPEDNGGIEISHNVLHTIFDDGMETSGGQTNNRFHDNLIENARIAIRIKNPDYGPLFIYRNVFLGNKSDMTIWTSGKSFLPAEVWVYQNTSTSDVAIGTNFRDGKSATQNYHFLNNLFWCLGNLRRDPSYPLPTWASDNNVFVAVTLENPRPWATESDTFDAANRSEKWQKSIEQSRQAGIDKSSVWSDAGQPGFSDAASRNVTLTAESPARGAGRDLSKNTPPLPGCEPGYFKGEKPDAGALQAGERLPALPQLPPLQSPATASATPAP